MASPMTRLSVKADNSCLFTSWHGSRGDRERASLKAAGGRLREACRDAVLNDPTGDKSDLRPHPEAYGVGSRPHLGRRAGGADARDHFGVEVVICSCESLNSALLARGGAATRAAYLLYRPALPAGRLDGTLISATTTMPPRRRPPASTSPGRTTRRRRACAREARQPAQVQRVRRDPRGRGGLPGALLAGRARRRLCTTASRSRSSSPLARRFSTATSTSTPPMCTPFTTRALPTRSPVDAVRAFDAQRAAARHAGLAAGMDGETIERRRALLAEAVALQYKSDVAATAGLRQHLATHPKKIVCVDIDLWLGMSGGGHFVRQNGFGRALMAVRDELMAGAERPRERRGEGFLPMPRVSVPGLRLPAWLVRACGRLWWKERSVQNKPAGSVIVVLQAFRSWSAAEMKIAIKQAVNSRGAAHHAFLPPPHARRLPQPPLLDSELDGAVQLSSRRSASQAPRSHRGGQRLFFWCAGRGLATRTPMTLTWATIAGHRSRPHCAGGLA